MAVDQVVADYQFLKHRLIEMGLYLWGGNVKGEISAISWEAESAGLGTNRHRDDNVPAKPKSLINSMLSTGRKNASLVILCHDTSAADVKEVRQDILDVEAYAKEKDCEINYYTMSSLYKLVVGKAP